MHGGNETIGYLLLWGGVLAVLHTGGDFIALQFLTPEEVAEDAGLTLEQAKELINQMGRDLQKAGYLAVTGRVQKWYYDKQKEAGFMLARQDMEREVPIRLDEKRLLCVAEFCTYASIGRDRGMELAEAAGAIFRAGKRVMIDRVKFDRWCDTNTELA